MSCRNCMDHKPKDSNDTMFTCPECFQMWLLVGVSPGRYWEPIGKEEDVEEVS
jgi:hypothetical protein